MLDVIIILFDCVIYDKIWRQVGEVVEQQAVAEADASAASARHALAVQGARGEVSTLEREVAALQGQVTIIPLVTAR